MHCSSQETLFTAGLCGIMTKQTCWGICSFSTFYRMTRFNFNVWFTCYFTGRTWFHTQISNMWEHENWRLSCVQHLVPNEVRKHLRRSNTKRECWIPINVVDERFNNLITKYQPIFVFNKQPVFLNDQHLCFLTESNQLFVFLNVPD